MSNLNTIALTGKNLEFWLEHSGLIKTLANNQGIYLKDVANTEFIASKDMFAHSHNKEIDWKLFVELASNPNTYSLSKGRQELISNINYDSQNGYTPRQAAEMLDYLMFNTPRAPNANIHMIEIPETPEQAPIQLEVQRGALTQLEAQKQAPKQELLITPIPQKSKGGKTQRQKQKRTSAKRQTRRRH
jgi:hypothetical protein